MLGRCEKPKGARPGGLRRSTAYITVAVFLFLGIAAILPRQADAGAVNIGLGFANDLGLTTVDIRIYVGRIVRYFLGLLGIIAVTLMIYAGYLYLTSAGAAEKIEKAKKIMINAVIGLVIIMSAYAIVSFILNALLGELGPGGGSSGPGGRLTALFSQSRGQDALGNGIVEYHYPEPAQTGVPRNTKVSITFKKPLVLSSVFLNYDDNGTFEVTDDKLCAGAPPCPSGTPVNPYTNPPPSLQLNTANVRLIANESLGSAGSGSVDEQFDNRHPIGDSVVASVKSTPVSAPIDPTQPQTIVFKPTQAIGSAVTDVNYRVSLRGGESGLKIWDADAATGQPIQKIALPNAYADGGYYWTFTTSTLLDTTPPQVIAVVPATTQTPGTPPASVLDRNQLLQIYFDEAVDPTTASGVIGSVGLCTGGTRNGGSCTVNADCPGGSCTINSGGFTNVEVQARCLSGDCPSAYADWATVSGTLYLGNRYRTAEFTPATICENIAENSCGEPVYCLPKNAALRVRTLAATIDNTVPYDPEPPAALIDNGVEDMVGNSLDGNKDGAAQGPQTPAQPGGRAQDYYLNDPPTDLSTISDTVRWEFHVGSNVDLTVPIVTALDPPTEDPPDPAVNYPAGPSNVPPTLPVAMTWSKTMSITSMRTGGFQEDGGTGTYMPDFATLFLRTNECAKADASPCPPGPSLCACTRVDPPGFFVDAGLPIESPPSSGYYITRIELVHPGRVFYTANDLGYTEEEIQQHPENIPTYFPLVRARIKDTKQNCFWPSVYKQTPLSGDCSLGTGQKSCCRRTGIADQDFLGECAPPPVGAP